MSRRQPPQWARLASNEDWVHLWTDPDSPLRQYLDAQERRLHDPQRNDHIDLVATKHALGALNWLHALVGRTALENLAVAPEELEPVADERSRLSRIFDTVVPTLR